MFPSKSSRRGQYSPPCHDPSVTSKIGRVTPVKRVREVDISQTKVLGVLPKDI